MVELGNDLGEAPVVDLVRNIALLRERCTALGIPVAYTTQPGSMTEDQRGLLKDFWGPGMSVSPEEREMLAQVAISAAIPSHALPLDAPFDDVAGETAREKVEAAYRLHRDGTELSPGPLSGKGLVSYNLSYISALLRTVLDQRPG